jgi:hypothetical protein
MSILSSHKCSNSNTELASNRGWLEFFYVSKNKRLKLREVKVVNFLNTVYVIT